MEGTGDMKITIKEIAKMANVSIATVSKVINNHPQGVSKSKREEIKALIKQYNYMPNAAAQSMVTQKTQCIGLLISDILNPFFQNLARGVEDYCIQSGYSVFLCNTDDKPEKYLNYIKAMLSKNVDGLIVVGYPEEVEEELNQLLYNKKVVVIGRSTSLSKYCRITTDEIAVCFEMTKYLIEMGHAHIACIGGRIGNPIHRERLEGYKKALDHFDIPYDSSLVYEGNFKLEDGYKYGKEILEEGKATAVFCFNDMIAQGVYRVCREYDKKIPEDMSVVGFDNVYMSELITPPLTTINQPSYQLGEECSRMLVKWIDEGVLEKEYINFDNELIIRKSVKRQ